MVRYEREKNFKKYLRISEVRYEQTFYYILANTLKYVWFNARHDTSIRLALVVVHPH